MKDNFKNVCEMLSEEVGVPVESISLDTRLVDDLHADSMTLAVIVSNIEDEYSVEIPDEAIKSIVTVADIVKYLDNLK